MIEALQKKFNFNSIIKLKPMKWDIALITFFFAIPLMSSCQTTTSGTRNKTGQLKVNKNADGTAAGIKNSTTPSYRISGPIDAKSNTTYSNLLIDLNNAGTIGIRLNGVSNVRIKNCKIINSATFAINIFNCRNITIEHNLITNVGFGIYAQSNCQAIKINNNQFLNINGINESALGHAVQFNGISGRGNQINSNRIENVAGAALHPHDMISLFKSDGLPGDSIQVIGNWIRGGQQSFWPGKSASESGACGIGVGDNGGSYQVVRNNILVNPGFIGIQAAGGSHISIDHNLIYSEPTPIGGAGLVWGNYTEQPSADVVYAYNQVKFLNSKGKEADYNANGPEVTLINNTWRANLTADILPVTIITMR
jgi:hypothetical protein